MFISDTFSIKSVPWQLFFISKIVSFKTKRRSVFWDWTPFCFCFTKFFYTVSYLKYFFFFEYVIIFISIPPDIANAVNTSRIWLVLPVCGLLPLILLFLSVFAVSVDIVLPELSDFIDVLLSGLPGSVDTFPSGFVGSAGFAAPAAGIFSPFTS